VATSIEGYSSVVTEGREALLVPPKDSYSLAKALERYILDANLRQRIGEQGLTTVRQYDWPIIARRVLRYYQQVVDGESTTKSEPHPTGIA
jgi:phosphatidylinositol alpha-mannosyltransferase